MTWQPRGTWADIAPQHPDQPLTMAIGCSRAEIDIVKQIPGCTVTEGGIWTVPLTWPGWVALSTIWAQQPIDCSPELLAWKDAKFAEVQERYAMRAALDCPPGMLESLLALETTGGPQLTPSQRGDAAWFLRWRRVMGGGRRGNGKTPPVIRALQYLHRTGDGCPALVICPDSGPKEWRRKLAAWAPELRTVIIAGSIAARRKAIDVIARGEADVGIITWGNVRLHSRLAPYPGQAMVKCNEHGGSTGKTRTQCEICLKELNMIKWRTVVPDEFHHMANPGSKQTRAVQWVMQRAENAWPLSGTVTVNSVADLWPVEHALDPHGFPVRSRYLDLFAQQEFAFQDKGKVILGLRADNREAFDLTVLPTFRRVPHEIARAGQPGLADPEFRYPDMGHKQAIAYKQITSAGLAELASADLVPANTVVKFTRQCQLAAAMIEVYDTEDSAGFTKEGNVRLCKPSHKVADLLDFLAVNGPDPERGLTGQWIVAANMPRLVELAAAALDEAGITHARIVGGMSYNAKDDAQQAFQRGDVRVIFCTAAGGETIDLQRADGIFWMQPDPRFTGREQMTGRADRWGREGECRQVYSITAGTVEVRLFQLGERKEEQHAEIVQDAALLRWIMNVAPDEIVETGDGNDPQFQPA